MVSGDELQKPEILHLKIIDVRLNDSRYTSQGALMVNKCEWIRGQWLFKAINVDSTKRLIPICIKGLHVARVLLIL